MLKIVLWICCGLLLYVYALYPVVLSLLAKYFGSPVRGGASLPTVTIIVTAYNEQKCIRAKLDNLSALEYPRELVTVLVASDGSYDLTEEIAAIYDPGRVSVLRIEGRQGKTACQNAAAAKATGEILVFTDATTRIHPGGLRALVANFSDTSVGCIAGRLVYVADVNNVTGYGNEAYWNYELRLRAAESRLGSLIGVSGCLYAVRKNAYRPIDRELISDFVIAMTMQEQRLRTVLAPDAVCFEETLDSGGHELAMRVRVAIRSLNALVQRRQFLNPWRYGWFAWQLWSHKVLRYASPVFWLGAFTANVALARESPYLLLLCGQCAIIAAGVAGFVLQGTRRNLGLFGRPYYLLLTNAAALIATLRYLRGERMVTWKPIR